MNIIKNYHLSNMKELTGYNDGDIIGEDIFELSKSLVLKGINIMLYNTEEGIILFVDKYRFQQR